MTPADSPTLTVLDKFIEDALANPSLSWMSRTEIAVKLGHEKLNTYHIVRLERLVSLKRVEKKDNWVGAKNNYLYRLGDAR